MQRGGTEDATDEDTSVSRVDVELVSDPGFFEALCINLRASVTGLRQVIEHLPQRHVTGSLAFKSCLGFRGTHFTLPRASPLAFHWLLIAFALRRRFLVRKDRSGVTTDMSDDALLLIGMQGSPTFSAKFGPTAGRKDSWGEPQPGQPNLSTQINPAGRSVVA